MQLGRYSQIAIGRSCAPHGCRRLHHSIGLLIALALVGFGSAALAGPFTGRVTDANGDPVANVRVRFSPVNAGSAPRFTDVYGTTDDEGRYSVDAPLAGARDAYIGVGKTGYLNLAGFVGTAVGAELGPLTLTALPHIDNEHYEWFKPFWPLDDFTDVGCNGCHNDHYEIWAESKMAGSARNPRVHSLYLGTDLDGAPAGPGYRVDYPDQAGPCANCHAAAASANAPDETVLTEVSGIPAEGVFCDVCHKVRDVTVDAGPGVAGSLQFQRPSVLLGLFAFGPFEDITGPMRTSYSAPLREARFCAGCHEWTNDQGVPVLSTFSEWSEMSGADPDALRCQDCHMKKKFGADWRGDEDAEPRFIVSDPHVRDMHGVLRPESRLHPHGFPGAAEHLPEAAALRLEAEQEDGTLVVTATVENANAGHALPTGMPFRNILLVVEATVDGEALSQSGGPTVPEYGGKGQTPGDYADQPGKGYARLLGDGHGQRIVEFWDATEVIEDTRLRAAEVDAVELRFDAPAGDADATIQARLIYRRMYRDIAVDKQWDDNEVIMAEAQVELALTPAPDAEVDAPPDAEVDDSPDADLPDTDIPAPDADDPSDTESPSSDDGCGCSLSREANPLGPGLALLLVGIGLLRSRRRR